MPEAILWGLIQGLTEFLPISSSGHLVLVPAFLSELGLQVDAPSLAVSAALHLGTLVAVLYYFRDDLRRVLRLRTDSEGRTLAKLVLLGTVPALVGLLIDDDLDRFQELPQNVGWALIGTGVVLAIGQRVASGDRALGSGTWRDALVVGVAQAIALIPGVSRSGITIAAGNGRRLLPTEAARFSFLLGIPAIAGGGLLQVLQLAGTNELGVELVVGMVVAALAGYAAIALLLAALRRVGLIPFAAYCLVAGVAAVAIL